MNASPAITTRPTRAAAPALAAIHRPAGPRGANETAARDALLRAARHLRAAALALARAWHLSRRAAADRRLLQAMSAQELTDLGLGRGEIVHLCGSAHPTRPFDPWRHP